MNHILPRDFPWIMEVFHQKAQEYHQDALTDCCCFHRDTSTNKCHVLKERCNVRNICGAVVHLANEQPGLKHFSFMNDSKHQRIHRGAVYSRVLKLPREDVRPYYTVSRVGAAP